MLPKSAKHLAVDEPAASRTLASQTIKSVGLSRDLPAIADAPLPR